VALLTRNGEPSPPRIAQAVILCGGLGTRLGELTRETPKPLLPVAGRPFLEILIQEITRYDVSRFLLLAAFRSEQIESFAREVGQRIGRDIIVEVAIEPDQAGTGGALYHARDRLDEVFYLFNGDTFLDTPLDQLARLAQDPEVIGALALRRLEAAGRYGVVDLEGDRITAFGRVAAPDEPAWINGGVAVFRRTFVDGLAAQGSFERDNLPGLAAAGRLRGLPVTGFFLDIGVPEDFARAQTEIQASRRRPAVFFDRDGVLNVNHGHVGTRDRFEWIEGAREAIALVNARGYYAFVVTNQAGIGKGFYSEADYHQLTRHIRDDLAEAGARIDDERYCPFHLEAVDEAYRRDSDWRKPRPGMLNDLIAKWPVDVASSVMIGDNLTDMEAAEAAGVAGHLFSGGRLDAFVADILEGRTA